MSYHIRQKLPYSPRVTIFAKCYHICQELPFSPRVTIFAKCYHICQELPYSPRVTIFDKCYHIRQELPFLPSVTTFAKSYHFRQVLPFSPRVTISQQTSYTGQMQYTMSPSTQKKLGTTFYCPISLTHVAVPLVIAKSQLVNSRRICQLLARMSTPGENVHS
jgi:hypothetical protein